MLSAEWCCLCHTAYIMLYSTFEICLAKPIPPTFELLQRGPESASPLVHHSHKSNCSKLRELGTADHRLPAYKKIDRKQHSPVR